MRRALADEGRQVPQKRFEGDDDVALARRAASPVPADLVDPAASAPILDLSETEIHLGEVGSDERLPPERVAVINRGGGTLEWTAESSASWVEPVARLSPFSAWRRSRCAGHTRPPPRTAQSRSTSPSTSGAHPRIVSVEGRGDRAEVVEHPLRRPSHLKRYSRLGFYCERVGATVGDVDRRVGR